MDPEPLASPARRRLLAAAPAALFLSGRAAAAAEPQYINRPWPEARPVPAVGLVDLDGRGWNLAALKGRPVLLNFWATWCEPCRVEMPSLDRLAARHAGDGLAVFAADYRESEAKVRDFLKQVPVTLTVLLDRDGEAARQWTPRIFPSTVLID
ncbi:MAG TPA: TlpA disulfide reductase family protein, partial [Ideonella sp.]|nr:TlpA disulfide reductase family protein [Ideonella sp.]